MKGTEDPSALYAVLPPGKHKLPKEFVKANQKARLFAGFALAVSKYNLRDVTVGQVVREARLSRRTFYDLVPNMDALAKDFLAEGSAEKIMYASEGLDPRSGAFALAVERAAKTVVEGMGQTP